MFNTYQVINIDAFQRTLMHNKINNDFKNTLAQNNCGHNFVNIFISYNIFV
jgi:hypothetical protein